eukprot:456627-Prymnesium_polylepis.1
MRWLHSSLRRQSAISLSCAPAGSGFSRDSHAYEIEMSGSTICLHLAPESLLENGRQPLWSSFSLCALMIALLGRS